ncbi:shikimate dehydrogenase [Desulfosediminicola ganghwensis]|uniref:shikimate dehydrogenase n=1 Tax=Desulfosediminicola ganghwensis TaxID=2569540 RepID=UPI0010AB7F29|nr:shikimate dehydrogenase [Desulfosediminicola ganghwensis]
MNISGKTRVFGIIGNPVSHSLSPLMHNAAFAELSEDCVYVPFPVEDLPAAIRGMKGLSICGASVTIPHKENVIQHLDEVDPVAARIGAVNTLRLVQVEGRKVLCGSNTDWIGANRALQEKIDLKGKRIIILGAGGSVRALGFGFKEAGAEIVLCSRTESRGRALADVLGCGWCSLTEVTELQGDILVNATSVGMAPNTDASLVPVQALAGYAVVMDIVYSPLTTRLLREAAEAGCITVNGLEMLLYQGVAQFELWTGKTAPVATMRRILLEATGNSETKNI